MARMSGGLHEIVITYPDGRECPCDWCDIWRAFAPVAIAKLDAWVLDHEPAVRPEWLGHPSEDV
jgi:hypothetical protein